MTENAAIAHDRSGLAALRKKAAGYGLTPPLDRFVFLRHGRTRGNAQRFFQSPAEPLDATGEAEAAAAARRLAGHDFTHILASDMSRAWQTAQCVAATTGRPMTASVLLRERFFGEWIGSPSGALDWREDPPGGETLDEFVARVVAGLAAALATGGVPLIVAHGGVLQVMAGALAIALDGAHTANATPLAVERAGHWRLSPLP